MAITRSELLKAFGVFKEMIDADIAANFVAKDGAKQLSTEDFTTALKEKLEGIIDEEITREDIANLFSGGGASTP